MIEKFDVRICKIKLRGLFIRGGGYGESAKEGGGNAQPAIKLAYAQQ